MPEIDAELGEKRLSEALQAVYDQAKSQFSMLPGEAVQKFERVLKLQIDSGFKYRCRPVQCPIAIIRTPVHHDMLFQGWPIMGAGGYTRIDIQGETFSILRPPQVANTGKRLGALLD
jgi:hypothetical protein